MGLCKLMEVQEGAGLLDGNSFTEKEQSFFFFFSCYFYIVLSVLSSVTVLQSTISPYFLVQLLTKPHMRKHG